MYSLHFYIQGHNQNYNLQLYKDTNTNRDKNDGVFLILVKRTLIIPCMHVCVRRLACMRLIN